jgi:hypothetical protein
MVYRAHVEISRQRSNGMVECETCELNPDCTRERARQHALHTGHVVHFVIEDSTTYRRKDGA